jgi:tyrosine-protein phosphatase YwqE
MEQSVELARAAEADGTAVIVATPHVRRDFVTDVSELPERVAEVRSPHHRRRAPGRELATARGPT